MLRLSGQGPLGRQVYVAIRDAVVSGELRAGLRLPSSRTLAAELGVSRTVTQGAYEQLIAEGMLAGRVGSGTYVAADAAVRAGHTGASADTAEPRLSRMGRRVLERGASLFSPSVAVRPRRLYDFRTGIPPLADFPRERWRRVLGRQARRLDLAFHDYGAAEGSAALRQAIADYLRRSRALACTPEEIVVVAGSQQGLDLAARLLVDDGDLAIVEEPGYEGARNSLALAGATLVGAKVDVDGIDLGSVSANADRARVAVVTPSHQYPTGAVLSMARRTALLDWAERADGFIVEDDYDGEFRFEGKPLAPLRALDRRGRVLYLGTFSKVMFPALRIGYLVLPPSLVHVFRRAKPLLDGGSSPLVQEALAEFVATGAFELYVRRLRSRMHERREALVDAVAESFGEQAELVGTEGGLHAMLRLPGLGRGGARSLVAAAAEREVSVYAAEGYYLSPPDRAELVLGYAALTPAAIRAGIKRLAAAYRAVAAPSPGQS